MIIRGIYPIGSRRARPDDVTFHNKTTRPFDYPLIPLLATNSLLPFDFRSRITHVLDFSYLLLLSPPPSTYVELLRRVAPISDNDKLPGRSLSINLIILAFIGNFYPRWRIDLFCLLTKEQPLINGRCNIYTTADVFSYPRTTLFNKRLGVAEYITSRIVARANLLILNLTRSKCFFRSVTELEE